LRYEGNGYSFYQRDAVRFLDAVNEPGGWFDRGKKQLESEQRDAQASGRTRSNFRSTVTSNSVSDCGELLMAGLWGSPCMRFPRIAAGDGARPASARCADRRQHLPRNCRSPVRHQAHFRT
jgi:hypothetical protein